MFELRFIERDDKKILQWRQVRLQIGWMKCDGGPVIQPVSPISFNPEKNWTDWEDIPGQCAQAAKES